MVDEVGLTMDWLSWNSFGAFYFRRWIRTIDTKGDNPPFVLPASWGLHLPYSNKVVVGGNYDSFFLQTETMNGQFLSNVKTSYFHYKRDGSMEIDNSLLFIG